MLFEDKIIEVTVIAVLSHLSFARPCWLVLWENSFLVVVGHGQFCGLGTAMRCHD
jgi:hypothetical protein